MSFETNLEAVLINGSGGLPPEIGDLALCRFMGWSWQELMATPRVVVEDAKTYRNKTAIANKPRK